MARDFFVAYNRDKAARERLAGRSGAHYEALANRAEDAERHYEQGKSQQRLAEQEDSRERRHREQLNASLAFEAAIDDAAEDQLMVLEEIRDLQEEILATLRARDNNDELEADEPPKASAAVEPHTGPKTFWDLLPVRRVYRINNEPIPNIHEMVFNALQVYGPRVQAGVLHQDIGLNPYDLPQWAYVFQKAGWTVEDRGHYVYFSHPNPFWIPDADPTPWVAPKEPMPRWVPPPAKATSPAPVASASPPGPASLAGVSSGPEVSSERGPAAETAIPALAPSVSATPAAALTETQRHRLSRLICVWQALLARQDLTGELRPRLLAGTEHLRRCLAEGITGSTNSPAEFWDIIGEHEHDLTQAGIDLRHYDEAARSTAQSDNHRPTVPGRLTPPNKKESRVAWKLSLGLAVTAALVTGFMHLAKHEPAAPSEQASASLQGIARTASSVDSEGPSLRDRGLEVIRDFYEALSRADGQAAAGLLVPEKRGLAAYQPEAISAFYGDMAQPLELLDVTAQDTQDATHYQVQYRYRKTAAVCEGRASVITRLEPDGRMLIAKIVPAGRC